MMKLKYIYYLSIMMILFCSIITHSVYAADSTITVTSEKITALNVPDNSTLIAAIYKDYTLKDAKMYFGSDTITANFKQDMIKNIENTNILKVFLWNMNTLKPICRSIIKKISELPENPTPASTPTPTPSTPTPTPTPSENNQLKIKVGDRTLTATLAENSSADALKEMLSKGDITINMSDYANFEKVGSLGTSLPRNDEQITTEPGDLILYQGNNITIYYDTNSWNFTRLGKINDITQAELKEILGSGDVTVTFSIK